MLGKVKNVLKVIQPVSSCTKARIWASWLQGSRFRLQQGLWSGKLFGVFCIQDPGPVTLENTSTAPSGIAPPVWRSGVSGVERAWWCGRLVSTLGRRQRWSPGLRRGKSVGKRCAKGKLDNVYNMCLSLFGLLYKIQRTGWFTNSGTGVLTVLCSTPMTYSPPEDSSF